MLETYGCERFECAPWAPRFELFFRRRTGGRRRLRLPFALEVIGFADEEGVRYQTAYLGSRGSARMVGWAMNASHHTLHPIPAHRVVNRNGLLTGKRHFDGPDVMHQLLESEGILFDGDQIINLDMVFWDPIKELL